MKRLILCLLVLCLSPCAVYSLEWKELHEKADSLTSAGIQSGQEQFFDSPEGLYVTGLVYLNEYMVPEAQAIFRRLAAINSDFYQAQWGLAEVLRRNHQLNDAETALKKIIADNPLFSPAYISLAYIYYLKHNFQESARLSHTVIEQGLQNVDRSNYIRALGLFAGAKGMIAHYGGPLSKVINGRVIMPYLKKGEKLAPQSPSILFGLGSYYLLIPPVFGRDLDKAREYLEASVRIDPKFPDAYVRLAQVHKMQGNIAAYNEYLGKALALDPGNELALDIKEGRCRFICVE